jgi:hypothetical protein
VIPKFSAMMLRVEARAALSPMMISEALYTVLCMVLWHKTADGTSYPMRNPLTSDDLM